MMFCNLGKFLYLPCDRHISLQRLILASALELIFTLDDKIRQFYGPPDSMKAWTNTHRSV